MAESSSVPWRYSTDGISIALRVTPRGGRDEIDGIETLADGRSVVKLRVRALAEGGGANRAVTELLAKALGVPKARVNDMQQLVGQTLDLAGHSLQIGSFKTREFTAFANIYAHFVDTGSATEEQFVQDVMRELDGHFQLRCGFICGKRQTLQSASGPIHGYSLMLHDVPPHKSLQLQDEGMGRNRLLGCGIFIPHKSIAPVMPANETVPVRKRSS